MSEFKGFPPEYLAFFRGLKRNNSKVYFDSKREIYQRIVKPAMEQFVTAVGEGLDKISPEFVADPATSPYRIYRDIRFSKSKVPYKTHAAALFFHRFGYKHEYPAFYFQIEPEEVMFAAGHYLINNDQLEMIRRAIDRNGRLLMDIAKRPSFRRRFRELEGEALRRPPRGYSDSHPYIELLKMKQFLISETVPAKEVVNDPGIVKRALDSFRAAAPLMQFLCAAVNIPF